MLDFEKNLLPAWSAWSNSGCQVSGNELTLSGVGSIVYSETFTEDTEYSASIYKLTIPIISGGTGFISSPKDFLKITLNFENGSTHSITKSLVVRTAPHTISLELPTPKALVRSITAKVQRTASGGTPLKIGALTFSPNKETMNVITEVIKETVISVETMHALNAWIKNLFVEYVETNTEALMPDSGVTERHYIRIIDEEMEFITATLSPNEVEPMLIPDPNGSGGRINVYYTSIGDHEDAYRYFTITDPRTIHKNLSDKEVEAFKVKVKKTLSESIKMKTEFMPITLANGGQTVAPVMTWGAGTDPTGQSDKGKGFILKDDKGLLFKYVTETGKVHEFRIGEDGVQGGGGGGGLTKADFYSDGYSAEYGKDKVDFEWLKDAQGRIKQLKNRATGQVIPISWNGGAMP